MNQARPCISETTEIKYDLKIFMKTESVLQSREIIHRNKKVAEGAYF